MVGFEQPSKTYLEGKVLVDGGARRLVQFDSDATRYESTPAGLEEIVVAHISAKSRIGKEEVQK